MEGEESKHVPESEIIRSPLQMPRVFNRLVELPIVKSTCGRVTGIYDLAKEKSKVAMIGLSATEVSLKAVGAAVKVTYTALPSSGLVGSLKGSFEKKVSQVDNMACNGLQFLENKWPEVKDCTGKVRKDANFLGKI
ncbi:uncharacterized protein LOC110059275 [Orbicella faveolata]|uniref:uncharacterized protein LOC110059275 n=1 Tax=Orbicella faveolata TaxID=48498 RepID=UPI0009E390CC|nr:uncharacterized protein LOC110059275 [Orbicella faveolata]